MKFRFRKFMNVESHCRNIVISNDVTINDQSMLYYDCYWSLTNGDYSGRSHMLDFEATDDVVVYRGRYSFNIPTADMLSEYIKVLICIYTYYISISLVIVYDNINIDQVYQKNKLSINKICIQNLQ